MGFVFLALPRNLRYDTYLTTARASGQAPEGAANYKHLSNYNLAPCNRLTSLSQWHSWVHAVDLTFMDTVLLGAFTSASYTPGGVLALIMQERHHRPVAVCVCRYACPDQAPEHLMSGRGSFLERKLLVSGTVAGEFPKYPWRVV